MPTMTGQLTQPYLQLEDIQRDRPQGSVSLCGFIHTIREMSDFAFVLLRTRTGVVQCVYESAHAQFALADIAEGYCVAVSGVVRYEQRAPNGFEVTLHTVQIFSAPEPMPVIINKRKLNLALDTELDNRPVTLRHPMQRAVFAIQDGIVRGFREHLQGNGFTEVHTPKLVLEGAEGGANIFKLDYFGRKAYLAQSPQFYKQTMVGVFERVFEVGPVFRAERHSTNRHINEYTSLDFEMGFIQSFEDIMRMQTGALTHIMALLGEQYAPQLALLGAQLPDASAIPTVRFAEAKQRVADKYKRRMRDPHDLEPEEEQLISRWALEELGSEFIFVTHYPSSKRPFYAMDDPADPSVTLSFDLLFRGMEITTGGQRIHDYHMQLEKMRARGMDPDNFKSYLMIHRYGMPPHGGLGMGLERLTGKLLGMQNIRQSTLFPRDMGRLEP